MSAIGRTVIETGPPSWILLVGDRLFRANGSHLKLASDAHLFPVVIEFFSAIEADYVSASSRSFGKFGLT
jgi:hypothetical protein